jgi:hypothetical protein
MKRCNGKMTTMNNNYKGGGENFVETHHSRPWP